MKTLRLNLADIEKERDESVSRAHVSEQALQALQTELIQQKVDCQNLKSGLIRLGLSPDFLLDPNITLADLLTLPELKDRLPAELQQECQQCLELANIREDIARQQVLVTTLQSQINSLSAQHTAVQLANTQLAAEKEAVGFNLISLYINVFLMIAGGGTKSRACPTRTTSSGPNVTSAFARTANFRARHNAEKAGNFETTDSPATEGNTSIA